MCTVSIFPALNHQDHLILTFNRDEAVGRETFSPNLENVNECEMIFPKDAVAGGTWLGISERKRIVGLMNGEFKAHKRNPPYRKSRGVIVKEFLAAEEVKSYAKNYDFKGIEPFTMLCLDLASHLRVTEFVWDDKKLHIKDLPLQPRIWSSSPLYDPAMKAKRLDWFENFKNTTEISAKSIWDFHHNAGEGDKELDLVVDRGFLKTQSISQIEIDKTKGQFLYEELSTGEITTSDVSFLI